MSKRKYNWKARQNVNDNVHVDRSEEKKIKLDLPNLLVESYDDSNALVLPSKKRQTKVVITNEHKKKPLTKKQRKNLEKVIERKNKKSERAELFKKLADVQADSDLLSKIISTSAMQSGKPLIKPQNQAIGESSNVNRSQLLAEIYGVNKKKKQEKPPVEEDEIDTSDMSTDEDEINIEPDETEMSKQPQHPPENIQMEKSDEGKNNNSSKKENKPLRKTVHVPVDRDLKIEQERLKLPVCKEEQRIVEAINEHDVVIICGDTGTGKTTQIPQFLYEAGYAKNEHIIGVTEPRRVAAVCMSQRVGHEMNLSPREVSYQIRYEGTSTPETKIKFMTDGVLIKEVQNDFELNRYSVIILDEAHERSIYTDILIGLLSRIVKLRNKGDNPMKLIIMSATLRVSDFTENKRLFVEPPPVIEIESRQYPVTLHFNKTTKHNYIKDAYDKVCKINTRLPAGGILVFATSQQEVHHLCSKLRHTFPNNPQTRDKQKSEEDGEKIDEKPEQNLPKLESDENNLLEVEEEEAYHATDGDDNKFDEDSGGEILDEDDDDDDDEIPTSFARDCPMYVLPLYSLLPSEKQALVFQPPPEGCRLCVVATNVAETSLTIPGIKYVVDTGKVKTKFYDSVTGVSTFHITSISKASANQRSGRAGRTGPGHCYRLYSSAVFNDFELFSAPEISRRPIDDVVLQLKDLGIDRVRNFPFPTAPPTEAIDAAERLLHRLGALSVSSSSKEKIYTLTDLGNTMARFPVAPRYAKMLALGHQHDLMPYVIAVVAGLSVQEVFVTNSYQTGVDDAEVDDDGKTKQIGIQQLWQKWIGKGHTILLGDIMVLVKAICLFEKENNPEKFCEKYGIRPKAMIEIRKLRNQLVNIMNATFPKYNVCLDPNLPPPDNTKAKLLRQIVLCGLVDHIAKRLPDPVGMNAEDRKKRKDAYEDMFLAEPVFIHPTSVLFKTKPEFVVYQQIDETSRMYMKGITVIDAEWLPEFAPVDTRFDPPKLNDLERLPKYNKNTDHVVCQMTGKFGPQFWQLPVVEGKLQMSIDCMRWFAKFFLEGSVCSKLKPFANLYLSPASTMVKEWAHLQPRTTILLQAFVNKSVWNKETLYAEWNKDPKFLLKQYQGWLPDDQQTTVSAIWPPR